MGSVLTITLSFSGFTYIPNRLRAVSVILVATAASIWLFTLAEDLKAFRVTSVAN
jgi:hypothetical protein